MSVIASQVPTEQTLCILSLIGFNQLASYISQCNKPIFYRKHFYFPGAATREPASVDHPFLGRYVTTAPMRMYSPSRLYHIRTYFRLFN